MEIPKIALIGALAGGFVGVAVHDYYCHDHSLMRWLITPQPTHTQVSYDFVCFDMYGKYTTHEGVVLQTLSYGGTWILTLEDSTEVYYTQQHGETCVKETSTGVQP